MGKYYSTNKLDKAAKALERASKACFDYEDTYPFQKHDDPRLPAIEAEIVCAEKLIEQAREAIKER